MKSAPFRCAFCGKQGKKSKEDVFPIWSRDFLPIYRTKSRNRFTDTVRKRDAGTTKIPSPCTTCNNGWMSTLQNRAKPVISPLILNQYYSTITIKEAEVVRLWSIMTYMTFDTDKDSNRVFSDSELKDFAESQSSPSGINVYIALRRAPPMRGISHLPISVASEDKHFREVFGGLFLLLLGNFTVIILHDKLSRTKHSEAELILPSGFLNISSTEKWNGPKSFWNYTGDPREIIDTHYNEIQSVISTTVSGFGQLFIRNKLPPLRPLSAT